MNQTQLWYQKHVTFLTNYSPFIIDNTVRDGVTEKHHWEIAGHTGHIYLHNNILDNIATDLNQPLRITTLLHSVSRKMKLAKYLSKVELFFEGLSCHNNLVVVSRFC